jgi:hemin uptake protein HemP
VPNPNPRAFRFTDLSAGQRTLLIEHAGQVYRLSLTGQNKLILTK